MNIKKQGSKTLEKKFGQLSVGEFLRAWRESEGISQKTFAIKIGISNANLCDIELRRKGVSPDKANKIAKKIGYPPLALVKMAIEDQLRLAGFDVSVELKPAA